MNRILVAFALWPSVLAAQAEAVPAERIAARQWYRDAAFGMFIHWGVYSQLAQGEWVMENRGIPVPEYEWLASNFNPTKFDAAEWVSIAKAAGMKYITITARHHDGFSMFATRVNRYNIVDWTPFKRDVMKELAEECRRQGIKLFFYYSQSTGATRTTSRVVEPASAPGVPTQATGTGTSSSWIGSWKSCSPTMGR
jgi:alpha-L-fucosidase